MAFNRPRHPDIFNLVGSREVPPAVIRTCSGRGGAAPLGRPAGEILPPTPAEISRQNR